jgi:hypothetical protein
MKCFNVHVIWSRTGLQRWHTYLLVGSIEDIAMAKMAIPLLIEAMWKGVRALLKSRGEKWTARVGRAYYMGLRNGYIFGSEQGRIKAYAAEQKNVADRFAIVIYDQEKAREKLTEEITGGKTVTSRYPEHLDSHAYSTGLRDGKHLDLSGEKLKNQERKQLS